jgi:hypothetical protein
VSDRRAAARNTEPTDCGAQYLIPGVRAVTMRERLMLAMQAPLLPRKAQKPLTIGLFDEDGRRQLNLF